VGEGRTSGARVGVALAAGLVAVLIVVLLVRSTRQREGSGTLGPEPSPGGSMQTASAASESTLAPDDQRALVRLARQTLEEVVRHQRLPEVDAASFSSRLRQPSGCFVTLEIQGQLRGCIGHILPQEALYQAVMDNANSAALRDTRFSPVTPEELPRIEVEVSVLTVPQPLSFNSPADLLAKLVPNRDGVVLSIGFRRATFLPQVWEKLPDPERFLQQLSMKAGLDADDWRRPETSVQIYHVQAFKEHEVGK
jgi:uncharacterized protein